LEKKFKKKRGKQEKRKKGASLKAFEEFLCLFFDF